MFTSFLPAVSRDATVRMLRTIKGWQLQRQTSTTIEDLSARYNPVLRGWWNYYGSFYQSAMDRVSYQVTRKLTYWACRKYKRFAGHLRRSVVWLEQVARYRPALFIHWQQSTCRPATR